MARIFTAFRKGWQHPDDVHGMPPFFEAFFSGLQEAGNEVLCYHYRALKSLDFETEIPEKHRDMVRNFEPDLCILFNNDFWDISSVVDCPIIIYDVDSPVLFANHQSIEDNIGRYLFVYCQSAGLESLVVKYGAATKQTRYIPFFSEIKSEKKSSQNENIVFLGTNWLWRGYNFMNPFIRSNPSQADRALAQEVIKRFIANPLVASDEIYDGIGAHPQHRIKIDDLQRSGFEISGLRRINYLSSVAELGLSIHGLYWTIENMNYFPEVLSCVQKKTILTLRESESFYNSARIGINTQHIQATSGFSFRACDIMASNACLVTEYASDLKQLFPSVPIPTFTTPSEAHEQCKRLLDNENLRLEIVSASNEAIEQGFRFRHVLDNLEDFLNMSLRSNQGGSLTIVSEEELGGELVDEGFLETENLHFKTLRNAFGYSPSQRRATSYIKLGSLRVLRIVKRKKQKEVYLGFIPLLNIRKVENETKASLLAYVKVRRLFSRISKRLHEAKNQCVKSRHRRNLKRKYTKGTPISVCLFVSRISVWLFGDLYRLLDDSDIFEPIIVVKPFVSQGFEAMVGYMDTAYNTLKERGYRVVKGYDSETDEFLDVSKTLNPDIVFYTHFWPKHFHKKTYITQFKNKISFLVPYGFYVAQDKSAMNFEINKTVDRFFVATSLHKRIASEEMDNNGGNVFVTGSPKLDRLFDKSYQPLDVWKPQSCKKKRIIWAPHHEDKMPERLYQFDAFYGLADTMLAVAKHYENEVQFAFKPHPLLREKLNSRWGATVTDAYYQKWAEMDNAQLEEGEFIDLFLTSDAMILDSISFIAEYTITNKPALFTVGRNSRVYLNLYGQENYKVLYKTERNFENTIKDFIQNVVIDGNDILKEDREAFIDEYLQPVKGKTASENVFDNILDEIGLSGLETQHRRN